MSDFNFGGESSVKKSECDVCIDGPFFYICLKAREGLNMPEFSLENGEEIIRRKVGRPKKCQARIMPISQAVSQDKLLNFMQWVFSDNQIELDLQTKKCDTRKKVILFGYRDENRYRPRRQRGYKKNMACPLIDLLINSPQGYTTKVLTEEILSKMDVNISQENQQKMRRRIYEFLMVMRTTGLVYSEEQKKEHNSYIFTEKLFKPMGQVKLQQANIQSQPQQPLIKLQHAKLQSEHEDEHIKTTKRKQYNKKKSLCLQNFLANCSVRNKHLEWKKQRLKSKRQMRNNLKHFLTVFQQSKQLKNSNFNFVAGYKEETQRETPVMFIPRKYAGVHNITFAVSFVHGNYLSKAYLAIRQTNDQQPVLQQSSSESELSHESGQPNQIQSQQQNRSQLSNKVIDVQGTCVMNLPNKNNIINLEN